MITHVHLFHSELFEVFIYIHVNNVVRNVRNVRNVCNKQTSFANKIEFFYIFSYAFFCPGTITTHAESINSDLQCGLDRRLRHTQHWTHIRTS